MILHRWFLTFLLKRYTIHQETLMVSVRTPSHLLIISIHPTSVKLAPNKKFSTKYFEYLANKMRIIANRIAQFTNGYL